MFSSFPLFGKATLVLLFALLWHQSGLQAQNCCPYINSLQVLPMNPQDTSVVKIVVDVSTPAQGALLSLSHWPQASGIQIEACYYSGLLPAIANFRDTILLGTLPAGNYQIDFRAILSTDPQNCNHQDSTNQQLNFSVLPSAGSRLWSRIDSLVVFPPAPRYDSSFLHLLVYRSTPGPAQFISDSLYSQGPQDWKASLCLYADSAAASYSAGVDSIALGYWTAGTHSLAFDLEQSSDSLFCQPLYRDTARIALEVLNYLAIRSEHLATPLRLYPQPAREFLYLESTSREVWPLRIVNAQGQVYYRASLSQGKKRLEIGHWPRGFYWVLCGSQQQVLLVQ